MADLSNNYGLSEGVDCRTGKPVFNKLSCQSLRIFPAPPGYWEQEVYIPVRGTGPKAQKKRNDIARGMMFGNPKFVSCRHPDCWICMGQKDHPTAAQISAFEARPEAKMNLNRQMPQGVLEGEEYLFAKTRTKRSLFEHLANAIDRLRRWWNDEMERPS